MTSSESAISDCHTDFCVPRERRKQPATRRRWQGVSTGRCTDRRLQRPRGVALCLDDRVSCREAVAVRAAVRDRRGLRPGRAVDSGRAMHACKCYRAATAAFLLPRACFRNPFSLPPVLTGPWLDPRRAIAPVQQPARPGRPGGQPPEDFLRMYLPRSPWSTPSPHPQSAAPQRLPPRRRPPQPAIRPRPSGTWRPERRASGIARANGGPDRRRVPYKNCNKKH